MIGLFGIATAIGPLVLMVIFLIFTILFHLSMNSALDPLLYNLPKSLDGEEEVLLALESGTNGHRNGGGDEKVDSNGLTPVVPTTPHKKPSMFTKFLRPDIYTDYATLRRLVPHDLIDPSNLYASNTLSNDPAANLDTTISNNLSSSEIERDAYNPPSVASRTPLLWLPRDEAGVSRQEVAHTSKVIPVTDEGARLDAKGKVVWDGESGERPPIWEGKRYY
jgi:hypothetical protein